MYDHSLPQKRGILHAIALIKYLLDPIVLPTKWHKNTICNDYNSYVSLSYNGKEKTRMLFGIGDAVSPEEINLHISDLINQMRRPFSLSALLL